MWLAVDLTSFWFRLATFVVVSSVGFLILLEELFISRFGAVVGMAKKKSLRCSQVLLLPQ